MNTLRGPAFAALVVGLVACRPAAPPPPPSPPALPAPAAVADEIADAPDAVEDAEPPPPPAPVVVHKVPIGTSPVRGPSDALVTVVVFSDFECPYCRRAEGTLAELRRVYGDRVRIVWRDMPLSMHARAEPAAELARAARAQKGDAGFWEVHDLLFESQPKLEDADLAQIAKTAKLDVAKAMAAVKSRAHKRAIEEDGDLADDLHAGGAPCFFVNGRRLVGAKPLDVFRELVDEEIARAEALLAAGTPRAGVYDGLVKDGRAPDEPALGAIGKPPAPAPFRGAANAKVVIEAVGDYQCPFCRRGDATMDELLEAYPGKIKVVWRDKPLAGHPDAPLAAEAAREAWVQRGSEGFARMQRLLFANQRALSRADLDRYAGAIGLDMKRFASALDTRAHRATVEADAERADAAGVRGTPAFFVGPYQVSGALPLRQFRRLVDRILAPPPGTSPGTRRE